MSPVFYEPHNFSVDLFRKTRFLVDCHLFDYEESWYEEASETGYRPWDRTFPVPAKVNGLALAKFTPAQGGEFLGYVVQSALPIRRDLTLEWGPVFFEGGKQRSFWHGQVFHFGTQWLDESRNALERLLSKKTDEVFPVHVHVDAGILVQKVDFDIPGFGFFADEQNRIKYVV